MERILFHSVSLDEIKKVVEEVIIEYLKKPNPPHNPETLGYLTRKEVCQLLKISLPTLYEYTKSGILVGYRIGGRILYKISEIEKVLANNSTSKYKVNGK